MKNIKRTISIICVILLVVMVIATLVAAIFDNTPNMWIFKGCLACVIFIPIATYAYICLHKYAMMRSKRKDYYTKESKNDDKD